MEATSTKNGSGSHENSSGSIFTTYGNCATFELEHGLYSPTHYRQQNCNAHIVTVNLGGPIDLAWKSANGWQKRICRAGDIIRIVPYGTQVENIWLQPLNALSVQLDRKFTDKILDAESFKFNELCCIQDPVLVNLVLELYKITKSSRVNQQHPADMLYAESICITIILHMASLYAADGRKRFAPKGKLSSQQLKTIIDYTWSSIRLSPKLPEMARQVHLSPFHFARQFKRTVGISPYKFVLQLKIEHAKMVMKKYKGSIIDVAHDLNFADQAHFSNTFKRMTGVSPRRYLHSDMGRLR